MVVPADERHPDPALRPGGPIRGIPLYWQFIDMSFGVFGVIPLLIVRRMIKRLEGLAAGVAPRQGAAPLATT